MGGIFISYRRGDSGLYAGRLRDALSNHFGPEQVFRDIDSVEPGERFPRLIEHEVASCDALLALIGSAWLTVTDDGGRRRLDHSGDYVRREIAAALDRDDVLVIPVLLGNTSMPAAADLPEPLAALAERNAVRISDEYWDDQVARLTRAVEKVVKPRVVTPLPLHLAALRAQVSSAGGAGSANSILAWLWRKARPDTSPPALIGYADTLADAVSRRETVLLDQLRGGRDMVVDDLEFRAERRLRLAVDDAAGVLSDIGPYFRRQEKQRMVVLGEAGAGKTVLAVHLVLDQLRHRATADARAGAGEPVPVRINASGWDGSTDFTAWLSDQLATDYGLNTRVARAMVDSELILPVLDGLDEMDAPEAQPVLASAALDRLNEPPWRNRAVVVACRSRVYKAIRALRDDAGLQFATTLTLQPFSAEDIYIYLEQYRDELGIAEAAWAPVTDQLEQIPDGFVATALRTPWMLSLAATALQRGGQQTAIELSACRDTAQIRQILFASLISAAVESAPRTSGGRTYTEQDVERWLNTLARHFQQRRSEHSGGAQIALDQIWQLAGPRRCRLLHAVSGGFLFAFGFSLAALLLNGGVTVALWVGLAAGLVSMLWFEFVAGIDVAKLRTKATRRLAWRGRASSRRFAWRVPGRSRWRRGLTRGILVGLLIGIPFGLLLLRDLLASDMESLFAFALPFDLVLGIALVAGLVSGLGTSPEERLALGQDADRVIHDDLVSGLMAGIVWLAVFLTIGPFMGLASGIQDEYFQERVSQLQVEYWERNERAQIEDIRQVCPDHLAECVEGLRPRLYNASPAAAAKDWSEWLPTGLILGLSIGGVLAVVLAPLSAVAAGRYAVGSLLLGFTGTFPRRPARFLEWARNSGLLRVTGVAYQFRHDTYQQWLAAGAAERGVETTLDSSSSRLTT